MQKPAAAGSFSRTQPSLGEGKRFGGEEGEEDSPWLESRREAEPMADGQLGVEV